MAKHTIDELRQWQALPLNLKIRMTEERIRMWVREYGEDGVYVSFSGGKDSTVLLDIVRNRLGYTDIPAVFVDTGLEYPEIREFVRTFDNVVWLRPKMQFRKVIEKYGYPFPSKEVSEAIEGARRYLEELTQTDRQSNLPYRYFYDKVCGLGKYAKSIDGGDSPNKMDRSRFSVTKYQFLLRDDAPRVSNKCCGVMKKEPSHKYETKSHRHPITGEMAQESQTRTQKWIQNGCNGFQMTRPKSTPMAFWTEQDVLQYIRENAKEMAEYRKYRFESKLDWTEEEYEAEYTEGEWGAICSVYGDIVYDEKKSEQLEGQLKFGQNGVEESECALKTTGCKRTGCMFCGFGCTQEAEGEGRFERMKETHPKQYEWIMRDWDNGGLGYKKVIDWINEHGNLNIRY